MYKWIRMIQSLHPLAINSTRRSQRITFVSSLLQKLRMTMHTRHQPQTNNPPDRLCNLSLINRSQTRLTPMLDSPHRRHILAHDTEVLIIRQRVKTQHVKDIPLWFRTSLPLRHLHGAQVLWGIDIACFPAPGDLSRQIHVTRLLVEIFLEVER